MKLTLVRTLSNDFATYGYLEAADGTRLCVTLELPWRDNAHDISCIPVGSYPLRRRFSPHHGIPLFWIDDVPDRKAVELHIGNLPKDSLGCVLLGVEYGTVSDFPGILGSRTAFNAFMAYMEGTDEAEIEVRDHDTAVAA